MVAELCEQDLSPLVLLVVLVHLSDKLWVLRLLDAGLDASGNVFLGDLLLLSSLVCLKTLRIDNTDELMEILGIRVLDENSIEVTDQLSNIGTLGGPDN